MQNKPVSAQNAVKKAAKSPIVFTATPSKEKVCLGESGLRFDLEITNVSKLPVIIDKKQLGRGTLTLIKYKKGEISELLGPEMYRESPHIGDYIKLAPKEKYQDSYYFSFWDEDSSVGYRFFNRIGTYKMKFTYAIFSLEYDGNDEDTKKFLYIKPTDSNYIKFRIVKCEEDKSQDDCNQ